MSTSGPTRQAGSADELAGRAGRALYEKDTAARALGIQILEVTPGGARLSMRVRADMTNGHEVCHGGMVFTLADTAFAYACNSYGDNTLAAAASIDFLAPAYAEDALTATARELWRAGRSGLYEVIVTNQKDERVALFRGRSHRITGKLIE
ncbi:MAG TPA: hydroxyphenylacetyl-CoA thioesterase PaaI [Steroidobacteraceae bacterium]|nr:hydroxyphenylacetyl-CoA thioesterase PaaI [Steroidobacteraceae bacterium]